MVSSMNGPVELYSRTAKRDSFINAWRWLQSAKLGDLLPKLVVNPHRPNRLEPRVRKRRPKQYPLMPKPRRQLKKVLDSK